jgi:hypothetical protein
MSIGMLIFAGQVFAGGDYQRTDDRKKTLVWNNDPKPGDAAEWTGKRDPEGYAEGPGTLTWLRPQKQSLFSTGSNIAGTKKVPISKYTGTMVHGKFDGIVSTVERGKSYHAKFVDGERKGNWAAGPIIAKATGVEPAAADESKKAPSVPPKLAAAEKMESLVEPKTSEEQAEPEPPTEGPDEAKAEDSGQRPDKRSAPLIAQASGVDESATPRQQPVTKKAALAPGAVRAIEKPGEVTSPKPQKPKQASAEKIRKATKVETPKPEPSQEQIESPAEGPQGGVTEKPQLSNPKPALDERPQSSRPATVSETPVDNSIRTLTGPPAALRVKSPAAAGATPAAEIPEPAMPPAAASANTPKLNAVQAMDIADIEARTKGYDLGDYQLPKAEYNAAGDTWSVSYTGREKKSKQLSVTIQDKSGKAEVQK